MRAIYPGTFDPMTNGHLDIVERGILMFNSLVIGVAENRRKQPMFSIQERLEMVTESVKHLKNVEVKSFSNLLVHFMKDEGANVILRGLRVVSDFEYELQLALMNRKLYKDCETVFLMPNKRYIFLSSSMIREIAILGGDVCELVPPPVKKHIERKCKN
jgi:pantetheine-phosphate adenylyltransferase